MSLKHFLDEAFVKGKNIKEELLSDILSSRVLSEMFNNEMFVKAVSRVVQTKEEVSRVIRKNVKSVFELMDVPSRTDLFTLQRKIDHLEKLVDRVGKRAITVKSLKKLENVKRVANKIH